MFSHIALCVLAADGMRVCFCSHVVRLAPIKHWKIFPLCLPLMRNCEPGGQMWRPRGDDSTQAEHWAFIFLWLSGWSPRKPLPAQLQLSSRLCSKGILAVFFSEIHVFIDVGVLRALIKAMEGLLCIQLPFPLLHSSVFSTAKLFSKCCRIALCNWNYGYCCC